MKIKICGLFRPCDIDFVNEALPDYIGFVFAKSSRQISFEQGARFKKYLNSGIKAVGVFVNEDPETVNEAVKSKIIDMVQLHGQEDEAYINRIQAPVIKAVKPGAEIPSNARYILFDSAAAGSGNTFDWSLIPQTERPFFLAGGINAMNIKKAVAMVNPYAIDLSSGVETEGVKDREKILEIVKAVRNL